MRSGRFDRMRRTSAPAALHIADVNEAMPKT